ncbi:MAG: hypothetical protein V9F01_03020 [Chitinophagaceae bacterium]
MKKLLFLVAILFSFYQINAQNVGIGTTSPQARLHVTDSSVLFSADGVPPGTSNPPASGAGRRTMWYAGKAAFRTGYVNGTQWNKDSIGLYSFAAGHSNIAKGVASGSFGAFNNNSGDYSFAAGTGNIASGEYSTAFGLANSASGNYSFSMGINSAATAAYAVSIGNTDTASGNMSVALGFKNKATAWAAFAQGESNLSSGQYSVSQGLENTASGLYSSAVGYRSQATGEGSWAQGFDNIAAGNYSFASGNSTLASGAQSTARGIFCNALADYSLSIGYFNNASGISAVALGALTTASGGTSFATGQNTTASGSYSGANGLFTYAKSNAGFTIGIYNDAGAAGSANSIDGNNRLFEVGNGISNVLRNNAFTILQNGNTGVNTTVPAAGMDINADLACRQNVLTLAGGLNSDINAGRYSFVKITGPAINFSIDGIQGGVDGKVLTLFNLTGTNMTIVDQTGSASAPANRINTLEGGVAISTTNNGSVTLQYSAADNRWMVIAMKE